MSKGKYFKKVGGFKFDYVRYAKKISKGGYRRLKDIKGVALHWTEGMIDTCYNECDYFATGNTRAAGAHIFIDRLGYVGLSIGLKRVAWSVMSRGYTSGRYDGILDNTNTISIELCGCADRSGHGLPMSPSQYDSLIQVLYWIKSKCPNLKHFVRHYDIKTKNCPDYYVKNVEEWSRLKNYVESTVFGAVKL